jgi:hypothetical protein
MEGREIRRVRPGDALDDDGRGGAQPLTSRTRRLKPIRPVEDRQERFVVNCPPRSVYVSHIRSEPSTHPRAERWTRSPPPQPESGSARGHGGGRQVSRAEPRPFPSCRRARRPPCTLRERMSACPMAALPPQVGAPALSLYRHSQISGIHSSIMFPHHNRRV